MNTTHIQAERVAACRCVKCTTGHRQGLRWQRLHPALCLLHLNCCAGIKLLLQLQEIMVQPCHAILKNATLVQVRPLQEGRRSAAELHVPLLSLSSTCTIAICCCY